MNTKTYIKRVKLISSNPKDKSRRRNTCVFNAKVMEKLDERYLLISVNNGSRKESILYDKAYDSLCPLVPATNNINRYSNLRVIEKTKSLNKIIDCTIEICQKCNGSGYYEDIEIEAVCCNRPDIYGECCGIPEPSPKQVQKLCNCNSHIKN